MKDKSEKLAFSLDETAERTGLCRDRLYKSIRSGELEVRKVGRRSLVTADALNRFLAGLPRLELPQSE